MDGSRRQRVQHSYPRTARLNALLHQILAEEVERLADADERLRLLTLTAVFCEPDLRRAKVLLASMPEGAKEALEDHRKALQATIAAQARLRRTPMLVFLKDAALEAAERVEEALRRAAIRPVTTGTIDQDAREEGARAGTTGDGEGP